MADSRKRSGALSSGPKAENRSRHFRVPVGRPYMTRSYTKCLYDSKR